MPRKGKDSGKPRGRAPAVPEAEGLNYKQRLFVCYYLGECNGNATDAARRVGYAEPHSQGPRLLENVGVRAAIDAALLGPAMAAEEVLARLSEIAAADMGDFVTISKAGKPTINLTRAKAAGKLHLVKALKPTKFGLSLVLHDALAALEKLGRHHGLFEDRPAPPDPDARPRLVIPEFDGRFESDNPGGRPAEAGARDPDAEA